MLEIDEESIAIIRATLDRVGFDIAQQGLRPDYFTAPYPNLEDVQRFLPSLEAPLAISIKLLSLAMPVDLQEIESALGRNFVEAGLACGLLEFDDSTDQIATSGYSLVSQFGAYFIVSINPYYPTFDPFNGDVYMGPDSFSLAHEIRRRTRLIPSKGRALDLCTGSGIAGLTASALSVEVQWSGIDLSPQAVNIAAFNAELNGRSDTFSSLQSDLFDAVKAEQFEMILANPPFIPVPSGSLFPGYGAGGEDGLDVLRPLLAGLPNHLTERGSALIYAEGVGTGGRLLVEDLLGPITSGHRDVELTIISESTIDNALYTLGVMLAKQRPSRLAEIVNWRDLFVRLGSDTYCKFFIQITPGTGRFTKRSVSPDPRKLALLAEHHKGNEA